MIIAIDIDNTLWDFSNLWIDYYNRQYNDNINPFDEGDYSIGVKLSEEKAQKVYSVLDNPMFYEYLYRNQNADLIKENVLALKYLNDNHDVYIVTSTIYTHLYYKIRVFLKIFDFIKPEQIITMNNKWLFNADLFIDDNPIVLQNCLNNDKNVLKINQFYNSNIRCNGADTFYDVVQKGRLFGIFSS